MALQFEVWVPGEHRYYRDPIEIIEAHSHPDIAPALVRSDDALRAGRSIAGFITYEAGVMLEGSACDPELPSSAPLLMLGVFDGPRPAPATPGSGAVLGPLVTSTTWADYERNIEGIRRSIRDGDVYQVNLTVPFAATFEGDPLALFSALTAQADAPYAAFVRYGSRAIVSCSPELFLEFRESTVFSKPMKGTSKLDALSELRNEKNRAEHVMIVDLMRNDLGRIGPAPRTTGLFTVERYPTFATMTTTIETELAAEVGLPLEVFAATHPASAASPERRNAPPSDRSHGTKRHHGESRWGASAFKRAPDAASGILLFARWRSTRIAARRRFASAAGS